MDDAQAEAIVDLVRSTMREQQQLILKQSVSNFDSTVEKKIRDNNSKLRDTIDDEVAGSSRYEDTPFRNNINKNNFNFCQQIDDI